MKELFTPRRVNIYFTHRCNLSCHFCYYKSFQKEGRRDLPVEEWEQFLDELGELQVLQVGIYGGEPLLRNDLVQLVRRIAANRMRFCLITNGTLLDEKKTEFLASSGRCDYVQISVDGMEKEHDAIRGQGNWRKAVRALELLKRAGITTHVNMVTESSNLHSIAPALRFLFGEAGVDDVRVNMVALREGDSHCGLSDEETAALIRETLPLAEKYPRLAGKSAPLRLYRELIRPVRATPESPFRKCGGLLRELTVRADGAVLPCPPVDSHVLGWINRDRLEEIWHNAPLLTEFRRKVEKGRKLDPECRECSYSWYCRQVCPANPDAGIGCRKKLARLLGIEV